MHLIIDSGSAYIKMALLSEQSDATGAVSLNKDNLIIYNNCIAYSTSGLKKPCIGLKKILKLRTSYTLDYPTTNGIITNSSLQVLLWKYGIDELCAKFKNKSIKLNATVLLPFMHPNDVYLQLLSDLFLVDIIESVRFVSTALVISWAIPHNNCEANYTYLNSQSTTNDDDINQAEIIFNMNTFSTASNNENQCILQEENELHSFNPINYWRGYVVSKFKLEQSLRTDINVKVILDLGYASCTVIPIYDNVFVDCGIYRNAFAGNGLFSEFKDIVQYRSARIHNYDIFLCGIMDSCLSVSLCYEEDVKKRRACKDQFIKKQHQIIPAQTDGLFIYNITNASTKNVVDTPVSSCVVLGPEPIQIGELLFRPCAKTLPTFLSNVIDDNELATTMHASSKDFKATLGSVNSFTHSLGIHELIKKSIGALPPVLQRIAASNIYLVGTLARIKNLPERLLLELSSIFPDDWNIRVFVENNPELSLLRAAANWCRGEGSYAPFITRSEHVSSMKNKK